MPRTRQRWTLEKIATRLSTDPALLNYLVHVDDRRRIAYFETPKVACTSIKKFMQDKYDDKPIILDNRSKVHDRRLSPLKSLRELAPLELEAVFWSKEYRRFFFVRNPFTRVLSAYLDKIVTNKWERNRHLPRLNLPLDEEIPFIIFLETINALRNVERDIHFATQASLIPVSHISFNFIGCFETFDQSFKRLQTDFYHDDNADTYESFGMYHSTGAADRLKNFYGPKEIDMVRSIYYVDFAAFGYSHDIEATNVAPEIVT